MASRKAVRPTTPEICPVCGEDVPRNALACPECGADDRSGWREGGGTYSEEPSEEFDYDEFLKDEFGTRIKPKGIPIFWWIAAIMIIVALGFVYVRRGGL